MRKEMREFFKVIKIELGSFPKVEALAWIVKYIRFKMGMGREMRMYSQNGEDGIIQYIFEKIGETNKYFVEFGTESGRECNTRYLREKGWTGLWMDGKFENSLVRKEMVTPKNVELLFRKYRVPYVFDLLAIDIDSYDYWVWKAISNYSPRVVVIEYNSGLGINRSITVPYDFNFQNKGTNYFGASLKALVKLGKTKGYRLVGCDSRGINAFFVREEMALGKFPELSYEKIYRPPKYGIKIDGKWMGYKKSNRKMVEV